MSIPTCKNCGADLLFSVAADGLCGPCATAAIATRAETTATCKTCGADLMFVSRQRGDGLCGPCSRKAADPLCPNCRERDGHHDAADREGHGCMFCRACCEELAKSKTIDHDALVRTLGRVALLKATASYENKGVSAIGRAALLADFVGLLDERRELRARLAKVRDAIHTDQGEPVRCLRLLNDTVMCAQRWPLEPTSRCVVCAVREALA